MRRPDRNIEIFSMSVLDMFASALGAFIMVTVILYPYYNKDQAKEVTQAKEKVVELKKALEEKQEEKDENDKKIAFNAIKLKQAKALNDKNRICVSDLNACSRQMSKTFLLFQINWAMPTDINLEVTDALGRTYTWMKSNRSGTDYPDSGAQLSIDVAIGPGIEVWSDPDAVPGRYQVAYTATRPVETTTPVSGLYFTRYGRFALPRIDLAPGQDRVAAATLVISDLGEVSLETGGAH